jgi:hypothetical protein
MYRQWLSGLSIRRIAFIHGLGRMAVYGAFVRAYGKDCCNLQKQSFARVLYKDYGDLELALRGMDTDGLYRTAKTEQNYSNHEARDLDKYCLTYEPEPNPQDPLRLDLYVFSIYTAKKLIYLTMMSRMNRMTVSLR